MDCDTALTLKTSSLPTNPLVVAYNSYSGNVDYTSSTGLNQMFLNADAVACPVTTCVLKDKTCSTIPAETPTTFFI
jgi:hypothetical protein